MDFFDDDAADCRRLASIQQILALDPIPGADRIEAATVLGWQVVVGKGLYKVGDRVIFIEIDAFVPHTVDPTLSKGKPPRVFRGLEGERLRTIRLRGQISQGLIIPDRFPDLLVDSDVTAALGIIKYEVRVYTPGDGGVPRPSTFPGFLEKTKLERVQNLTERFNELKMLDYERTEKVDGSSATAHIKDGVLGVSSHHQAREDTPDDVFWTTLRKAKVLDALKAMGDNWAFQGELIGPKIQRGHYELDDYEFLVFDCYNIQTGAYLLPAECRALCRQYNLEHVPVLDICAKLPYATAAEFVKDVLDKADGHSYVDNHKPAKRVQSEGRHQTNRLIRTIREGDVYKANTERRTFKVISNAFLEREKDC